MTAQAIRDAETLRRLATGWRLRLVDATALLPIADRIEQMGADLDEQRGLAESGIASLRARLARIDAQRAVEQRRAYGESQYAARAARDIQVARWLPAATGDELVDEILARLAADGAHMDRAL